ncbi:MAG: AMP-binding protein [Bacteroidota bacterium]
MTSLPRTIPAFFESCVSQYSSNVLILEHKDGSYRPSTYRDVQALVYSCAAGFLDLGLEKGDRVGLISEGRAEWVTAELGVLYAGGVSVPLSVKIEELPDLKFRLAHSGCRMVIVSGNQVHKILKVRKDLPDLETVILLDQNGPLASDEITFNSLISQGQGYLKTHHRTWEERWNSVQPSDYATISYTSGTTADPKGIILTHANYTSNVEQCNRHLPLPSHYCTLLILPWDHAFAHTAGVYLFMSIGAAFASVQAGKTAMETLRNIPVNLKEIRPHFLLSVPALAKNFRKNIEKGISDKGAMIKKLFDSALDIAYKYYGNGWNGGKKLGKPLHPVYRLCDVLIFRKIRQSFGGRLEFFIGGAAVLDTELQQFFNAIGIPMYQGYGLTEASPVISTNTPNAHKFGSSGRILPGVDVKIRDEQGRELPSGEKGEITVKGENVMTGYWKNERATNEVLKNRWLHTGDIGYIDTDGFLFVLGREKSVLISHDGEKYSPEGIEEAILAHSPYIDQIMLYNNQSPYTIALIVPSREALLSAIRNRRSTCQTNEGQEHALGVIQSELNRYREFNKTHGMFPERWLPSAAVVVGESFTEQNRMLNSTLKMVRGKITEFYKTRIDYAFTVEGKDIMNHQNRMIIRRLEET